MLLWTVCLAVVFLLYLLYHHQDVFQDIFQCLQLFRIKQKVLKYRQTNYLILDRFLELVKKQPHKPLVLFKDQSFTYQDADLQSSKAARVFLQSGIKQGETVALFMGNEPIFLWLWLALVKIGCSAAFINCNIRSNALLHCFKVSGARTLVAAEELQDAVEEIRPLLCEQQVNIFILSESCKSAGMKSFKDKMTSVSEPVSKDYRSQLTHSSPAVYIYTSGTTGLSKAALITHGKIWATALRFASTGLKSSDVLYVSLPLYHTAGFLGFLITITKGATVAVRTKFSSSQFWDDCRRYDATVIQYIGEIMRYLCNTPKKPNDKNHKVRLAIGNGIRTEVWREFIQRFGNVDIREFYGATEGNFGLVNYNNRIGAVGRDTFLYRKMFQYALIQYDVDTGEPLRDLSGLCIKVTKGEPGLLVSEITLRSPFLGYAGDLQQTEKKKLHNVLKKGDMFFNTGDVLLMDQEGYFYFHDRVGDTFRWKGENVSTNEVSDVLTLAECIRETNVYGVQVPGHEGKVGMAAVTLKEGHRFDSAAVYKQLNSLPSYARPCFVRIQGSLDTTGTFKLLKTRLMEEGFNCYHIKDPIYFRDEKEKNFIPLTAHLYNSIIAGNVKI